MESKPYALLTQNLDLAKWPKRWLQLGVLSLGLAGVFSVVLVIARTPQLIEIMPQLEQLFKVSLVVHVDLSVLVWFLAGTGMLWAMLQAYVRPVNLPFFNGAGWWCMLGGTLLITFSPFTHEWEVIKSNYIPVITNLFFFMGLGLVMASMVIMIIQTVLAVPKYDEARVIGWGIYVSVYITAFALIAFVWSYLALPTTLVGHAFFETIFWAGGHILQFTYVQSMLVAWCLMALALGYQLPVNPLLMLLLIVGGFFTAISFMPYLIFEVTDQEHMDYFTLQMNAILGISGVVLGLCTLYQMIRSESSPRELRAVKGALLCSILLFGYGGLLGANIGGSNTQIPAHYHGSIVAVTLSLMGLAYLLLPKMGYANVAAWRMARCQPYVYAFGQVLHISGLAYSGGYGVLRKTVGDTGDGSTEVMVALGVMGAGGMLAIIGGLLFVIVMVKGFLRKDTAA